MTKAECLAKAAAIRAEMECERSRAATCAMIGIAGAWDIYNRLAADAEEYEWLAKLHPKTRASIIRGWSNKAQKENHHDTQTPL